MFNIDIDLHFPDDFPKGQVFSFIFLFSSIAFGVLGYFYQDKDPLFGYIFATASVILIPFAVYSYARFLPCKERVPEQNIKTDNNMSLCPRCTGFYVGVLFFTILMVLLRFYGAPNLSTVAAYVLLFIGLFSFTPAAIHGIARRYYKKDLSPKASLIFLYVSGFLTAFGGFLVGLALITLLK